MEASRRARLTKVEEPRCHLLRVVGVAPDEHDRTSRRPEDGVRPINHEALAQDEPRQAADARVEQVLEHDGHRIL